MSTAEVYFLPLLYKVCLQSWNPDATNDLGNAIEKWDDPVELNVYGWGSMTVPGMRQARTKVVQTGDERYVVSQQLMVPPGFYAKNRDKIQLGSLAEIAANPEAYPEYKAVGVMENYDANPFGFNPGSVVNLVLVKG